MGFASFSFGNPEQRAEDALGKLSDADREAALNILLGNAVRGTVWGLLDTKYENKLSKSAKIKIADSTVDKFINQFTTPGSDVNSELYKLVERFVREEYFKFLNESTEHSSTD